MNATGVAHDVYEDGRWLGLPSSPAAFDDAVPIRCPYCKVMPPPRSEVQSATDAQLEDELEHAMATVRSLAAAIRRRMDAAGDDDDAEEGGNDRPSRRRGHRGGNKCYTRRNPRSCRSLQRLRWIKVPCDSWRRGADGAEVDRALSPRDSWRILLASLARALALLLDEGWLYGLCKWPWLSCWEAALAHRRGGLLRLFHWEAEWQ